MKICSLRQEETFLYAAQELQKYLLRMCPETQIAVEAAKGQDSGAICLGLLSDFGLPCENVTDPVIEDVIDIRIEQGKGHIAGSNPGSVLQGVYRYLHAAGCSWVRPGEAGEFIPRRSMADFSFTLRQKAAFPFRGQCIEGAVSYEHLCQTIEWLPKVGMNMFMMEQIVPYNYMSRWYEHKWSTVRQDEKTSYEQMADYTRRLELLIKKCGLQLHALGHGYLFEPWGVHYKKYGMEYEFPEEAREMTALVKGRREFFRGSPNFTQLCMSNPKARRAEVEFLVQYLQQKPEIDFLHVWLSDALNNQCECENCRNTRPSDFYVMMLNELDEALTKAGIDTRIFLTTYVDTLWAPEHEKIRNPARFLLSAATSRSYNEPICAERYDGPLPPYRRNDFHVDLSFPLTMSFLDAWKPYFDGPKFLFEYHLYTDHYFDPGYFQISRLLLEDIRALGKADFQGIMNDQTQRCYLPTGLPSAVMGAGLWEPEMDFDAFADGYFADAYGAEAAAAREYLETITKLFDPCDLRAQDSVVIQDTGFDAKGKKTQKWMHNPASMARLRKIAPFVDVFRPTVEKNLAAEQGSRRRSWELLIFHGEYCKKLAELYITASEVSQDAAHDKLDAMMDWLSHKELDYELEFDMVLFRQRMHQVLTLGKK